MVAAGLFADRALDVGADGWLGAAIQTGRSSDFAGGTVVHINAGIAGLVCALVLGKRVGYGTDNMAPYNLAYAVIGASLLWVGWFGFNAGSAVGCERPRRHGDGSDADRHRGGGTGLDVRRVDRARANPRCWAAVSGAVAGLVAITPASGFVLPGRVDHHRRRRRRDLLLVPRPASSTCFGYDDSLDCFGVHCIGGIVGALLTGVFSYGPLSATAQSPQGANTGGIRSSRRRRRRCRR